MPVSSGILNRSRILSSIDNVDSAPDIEAAGSTPVIGIFLHGGGYCHMSAHESSKTSKIPRRLMKVCSSISARNVSDDFSTVGQGLHRNLW